MERFWQAGGAMLTAHFSHPSWNFRTFDDSGMSLPKALVLGAVEHPLAQLLETCTAVGLSLDQLEAVDMSLDWSLAPFEREPGFYRLVVPLKPLGKTLQFSHSLLFVELELGDQLLALPLA